MKKCLVGFITAIMLLSVGVFASAADISAKSAVLLEANTNTVLYENAAEERLPVASITKIMTALIVLENCDLQEKVDVSWEHASTEGSSMYLQPGEDYTVEQLLYGLMLASGNDAAAALAQHTAGDMKSFAELMNAKCESLGLKNTHFCNSHGLDEPEHYSSAFDMALITAAALENETFCKIFSTESYTVNGNTYYNHNKLLDSYEHCIGGKTGYTSVAGRTLVSVAEKDGMRLICVTISAPDDWNDHCKLYEEAFADYKYIPIIEADIRRLNVISGADEYVYLKNKISGLLVKSDARVEREIYLPSFVYAPVNEGEAAGRICLIVDGNLALQETLYYKSSVLEDRSNLLTPWERFKRAWLLLCRYGVYYPEV